MKTLSTAVLSLLLLVGLTMYTPTAVQAQTCDGTGKNFVDLNGDGFNDNAPDADGDGIPNGLDPDYIKNAQDGDGYQNGAGGSDGCNVDAPDADGDGIPNGQDPDYIKHAEDGDGYKHGQETEAVLSMAEGTDPSMTQTKTQTKAMTKTQKFSQFQYMYNLMWQHRVAAGETKRAGTGIGDGTGGSGSGVCDGTGPKGNGQGGGK